MISKVFLLIIGLLTISQSVYSTSLLDEFLPGRDMERRAQDIMKNVMCVVCQGQTVRDSGSEIASSIRGFIRDRVQSGISSEHIYDMLEQKYGQSVSVRAPWGAGVIGIWLVPLSFLLAMFVVVFGYKIREFRGRDLRNLA